MTIAEYIDLLMGMQHDVTTLRHHIGKDMKLSPAIKMN